MRKLYQNKKKYSIDSVRLLDEIVEEMDLSEIRREYSHLGRKSANTPETMFKIILYGYMDRKYSSREIEKSCKRDINYIWLLNGEKAPNHILLIKKVPLKKIMNTLDGSCQKGLVSMI